MAPTPDDESNGMNHEYDQYGKTRENFPLPCERITERGAIAFLEHQIFVTSNAPSNSQNTRFLFVNIIFLYEQKL